MDMAPEPVTQGEPAIETAAPHPEEMKAALELRLGDRASLRLSARATPAGILSAALFLAVFVGAAAWVSRPRA